MDTSAIQVPVDLDAIRRFCETWGVQELGVFGSVVRDDFGPDSDVDMAIRLAEDVRIGYDWIRMRDELAAILGRSVDLVEVSAIRNPYRRRSIQAEYFPLYDVQRS